MPEWCEFDQEEESCPFDFHICDIYKSKSKEHYPESCERERVPSENYKEALNQITSLCAQLQAKDAQIKELEKIRTALLKRVDWQTRQLFQTDADLAQARRYIQRLEPEFLRVYASALSGATRWPLEEDHQMAREALERIKHDALEAIL